MHGKAQDPPIGKFIYVTAGALVGAPPDKSPLLIISYELWAVLMVRVQCNVITVALSGCFTSVSFNRNVVHLPCGE